MPPTVALPLAAIVAVTALASCGAETGGPEAPAFDGPRSTDSPIAGQTLRCTQDYPDSRLVFAPDGTISGRYAGQDVAGQWNAQSADRVEVLVQTGGMLVRDTMRRTATGWRGDNTACG
jgi:hypothetical protein